MKANFIDLKNLTVNRLLIVSLHIVGWVTFISLPFMFFGPRAGGRPPMQHDFRPAPNPEMQMPQPSEFDLNAMRLHSILFNVLLIGFFYLNMYVLIPRVLTKKSWLYYLASIVLCFVFVAFASEVINQILSSYAYRPRPFYFTSLNFLLVFGLSTALKFTSDRVQFERERKERENETLKSELSLLRSQVSPHFMFNVLNNLASLARKKSDQLESVIIQLSQLMRYMLYESGERRVTLDKEIEYLKSYIDLQKLRFGNDVTVDFQTNVKNSDLPIEPMLLIPFVENSFKHGMGLITDPRIVIRLSLDNSTLNFSVKNKFSAGGVETKDVSSGIGVQNVRRRLDLLYKDLHELKIYEGDQWFNVELKLILK
ncbi:MAG TPA: histidine kinase [Chryseolinea sp.]|nr:histidine kinase [Chryseolinea sp.]